MGRTGGGGKHSGMSHSGLRGSSTHHSTRSSSRSSFSTSSSRSSFSTSRNTSGFKPGSHNSPIHNTSFITPPRGPAHGPGHISFGGRMFLLHQDRQDHQGIIQIVHTAVQAKVLLLRCLR